MRRLLRLGVGFNALNNAVRGPFFDKVFFFFEVTDFPVNKVCVFTCCAVM
jgi:hypothetical protein